VDKELNKEILEKLKNLVKKVNCLFIQIENVDYNPHLASPEGEEQKTLFSLKEGWNEDYYKKFITPYTAVIDLIKSEEEILANMKPREGIILN
jgi:lipid II:glycine glycyltransferase (peptidoglycan interpeptide bridge formation enzyme)